MEARWPPFDSMADIDDVGLQFHDYLMELEPDPFEDVYEACEAHREEHGPVCGVYPSNPTSM